MLSPPVRTHLPHTLLDAQHKLDEEIFRLEAHIVSLKVARNALSPISQLYPEILQEIFFLTHISSKQFSRGKASLTLTWVSHMWRDLAQSTSDLWTYIDFKDQKWIQAAVSLTRDRELCFDLNFASGQPWREKHLFGSFYLSHLHRTKTLEIHGLFQVSTRLYLNAIPEWTTPAPILGSLILDCVAIPRNVFSGFCPHLQLLHLMSCKVDWATLPTLIGLKDLHISMPEQRMTVHHLVDVLRSVAITLERLKFCDLLESSESTPDTGVRLQTLKMLSIQADDSNLIKEFLNQISFPPRTKTEISAPWDPAVLEAVTSSKNTSGWETDRLEFNASREGKLQTRKTGSNLQTNQSGESVGITSSLRTTALTWTND
ncbi:hypothetical protein BDN72DRAFT_913937 [Pluteus cervinus]|uniref:Uncharacterized protein n=1 Tax=Pluteus cervinus TaxID=181527 RepID=A0ACD3APS2_9AGAR|nr:hypothetical protein BDN72DRAFT_913937 [Pluteus cervinus]